MILKDTYFKLIILFAVVFFVYGFSLCNQFVYDDIETITSNPYVHSLSKINQLFVNKNSTSVNPDLRNEIYRPLKNLLCAVDYFFWQKNPLGFHFTNLLIHFLNVTLFFLLLQLFKLRSKVSFVASSIFALHPALAHNVAYITGRSDMMAAFFLLLAFYNFVKNQKIKSKQVIFFFLACLSKETAIVYPAFLSVYLVLKKQPLKKLIFFWGMAIIYFFLRQQVVGELAQVAYRHDSFWITMASMVKVWAIYLYGLFWPLRTYIVPNILVEYTWLNWRSLSALGAIFIYFFFLLKLPKKKSEIIFGFLWFIIFLTTTSNIIPIKALMTWRFTYISMIGMFWMFAELLNCLKFNKFLNLILLLWVLSLSVYTIIISARYKTDLTLWRPLIEIYPNLFKPYRAVAASYIRNKKYDQALRFYNQALKKFPENDFFYLDIARVYNYQGNYLRALKYLKKLRPIDGLIKKQDYLYDYLFSLYNLKRYKEVISTINFNKFDVFSTKSLVLQAHASVLIKDYEKALIIYKFLMKRDLSANLRQDIINLLVIIDKEVNYKN